MWSQGKAERHLCCLGVADCHVKRVRGGGGGVGQGEEEEINGGEGEGGEGEMGAEEGDGRRGQWRKGGAGRGHG